MLNCNGMKSPALRSEELALKELLRFMTEILQGS